MAFPGRPFPNFASSHSVPAVHRHIGVTKTMLTTPAGMSRRHFMSHMAGAAALSVPALSLTHTLRANAADLKKRHKAAILLWMSGGPSTMDIWDLKPGASTGGTFRPISTKGDMPL